MAKSVITALVAERRLRGPPYQIGEKVHEHANQIHIQILYFTH